MIRKRCFLQNIFIKRTNDILALNLFNYRRKSISFSQYDMLCVIDEKLNNNVLLDVEEQNLIEEYRHECQILDKEFIEQIDNSMQEIVKSNSPELKAKQVIFNLTYNCNFNCVYCYQNKYNELKGIYLNKEKIDSAAIFLNSINAAKNINLEEVIVSGGESLLPGNIDAIKYILKRFSGSRFKLFTNGVNIIRYWEVVQHFDDVQVSLDGDDESIPLVNNYNKPAFDLILRGIERCLLYNKRVTIIAMMTKKTKEYSSSFLKKLYDSKILEHKNLSMRFSTASAFSSKRVLPENVYTEKEYIETFQYVKSLINGSKIAIDRIYDLKTLIEALDRGVNKRIKNRIYNCNISKGLPLVFSPDGYVYWCSCINPPQSAIGQFYPVSELYMNKINDLMTRCIFKYDECKKCIYRYICASGCPLNAMDAVHDGTYPNACGIFKNEFLMNHLEEIL